MNDIMGLTTEQIKKIDEKNRLDYECYRFKRALADRASVEYFLQRQRNIDEAWKRFMQKK